MIKKKFIVTGALLLFLQATFAQSLSNTTSTDLYKNINQSATQDKTSGSSFGFFLDPLGFATFGPRAGVELTTKSGIINSWFRFSKFGPLLYLTTSDNEEGDNTERIEGGAIGLEYAYFFSKDNGGPYLGPVLEYGWTTCYYEQDNNDAWEKYFTYVAFGLNGGYKFRFNSGMFLKTGGAFGIAFDLVHEWQYSTDYYNDSNVYQIDPGIAPFGYLELAIGFEF